MNLNKNKELQNAKEPVLKYLFSLPNAIQADNIKSWAKIMLPLPAPPSPSKKIKENKKKRQTQSPMKVTCSISKQK